MTCFLIVVSGCVQGVFYRLTARQIAVELDIFGYVKNLANGTVELCITGSHPNLCEMIEWCLSGPEHAQVKHMRISHTEFIHSQSFEIIR